VPNKRNCLFSLSITATTAIFDILHFDIWGPCFVTSKQDFKYFLTVVDDYSRYTWVIMLLNKSEVHNHIINFTHYVEPQFHTKIKIMRTDNGPKFSMHVFFASKSITHQTSCVETSQQNGHR